MWPLVKKQMNHSKALRELQPEIKRIKQETKGDRQKESMMIMELYKEREINMFAPFGILLVQLPILIGLYNGLTRLIRDPEEIIDFSYSFIRDLPGLQELANDISKFDGTLFGAVDLTRSALPDGGGIYWPAMVIVLASAVVQYYQSKQLMPQDDKARSLRQILKEAGGGKEAEREEVTAATNRLMRYFIPVMIFFFTVGIPSALSLYWLVGGLVAFLQQSYLLRRDTESLDAAVSIGGKPVIDLTDNAKNTSAAAKTKTSTKVTKSGVKVTISRPDDDSEPKPTSSAKKKSAKRKRRKT